jgi:3-deoxy-D-arabino-heptulosonate 7-phosphate (DAHP) synthase
MGHRGLQEGKAGGEVSIAGAPSHAAGGRDVLQSNAETAAPEQVGARGLKELSFSKRPGALLEAYQRVLTQQLRYLSATLSHVGRHCSHGMTYESIQQVDNRIVNNIVIV